MFYSLKRHADQLGFGTWKTHQRKKEDDSSYTNNKGRLSFKIQSAKLSFEI